MKEKKFNTLEEKVRFLEQFITEDRKRRINDVLDRRVKRYVIALENIYDPHNISAVLRTADGMGFHTIYVIEKENRLKFSSGVTTGAEKWLEIKIFTDVESALTELGKRGYKIAAGVLSEESVNFFEYDWDGKWVFLFGNEHEGLTERAVELSDIQFMIPIYGFIQSYNISVSAAITMSHLRFLLEKRGVKGELTSKEKLELEYRWLTRDLGIKI